MESVDELLDNISRSIVTLEGWCTPEKGCRIARAIIENGCGNFVEVGVFGGRSLIAAAYTFKYLGRGIAWGVDPWLNDAALEHVTDKELVEWWGQKDLEEVYTAFMTTVINERLTKYCRWIREKSEIAARMFEKESLDMIHIDGNHSEEMSTLDVQLWLPRVRPGGIICMDDTDASEWPSIQKAVGILNESCDLIADCGGYSFFRKRASSAH